jgi:ChaC-like protein
MSLFTLPVKITRYSPLTTGMPFRYLLSKELKYKIIFSFIFQLAKHIHTSHGPSGSNSEYVLRLAEAIRELFPEENHHLDDHVLELELNLKQLMECDKK